MKRIFLIVTMPFILMGCSETKKERPVSQAAYEEQLNNTTTPSHELFAKIVEALPVDSARESKKAQNNFRNDISKISKDKKLSSEIQGTWELMDDYSSSISTSTLYNYLKPHERMLKQLATTRIRMDGRLAYSQVFNRQQLSYIVENILKDSPSGYNVINGKFVKTDD